jgi:hypothetical protein
MVFPQNVGSPSNTGAGNSGQNFYFTTTATGTAPFGVYTAWNAYAGPLVANAAIETMRVNYCSVKFIPIESAMNN